ncbi:MAG: hypothetical protein O4861_12990 [Trichodesmium sp. St16_bin4-tuft]|nr:hypothetical protein [Trichodesmium sp. St5_bin8]MDE5079398.1 hypothetical protein [Trichodesmium sp. St2_bin6]MDE5090585.1 hypothetical protein [Trichodesmium sp. St18_bin3_1_1]MDE5099195.1 hypothetical protein [Trichodesmium sp. St16_bin4-tuft]
MFQLLIDIHSDRYELKSYLNSPTPMSITIVIVPVKLLVSTSILA